MRLASFIGPVALGSFLLGCSDTGAAPPGTGQPSGGNPGTGGTQSTSQPSGGGGMISNGGSGDPTAGTGPSPGGSAGSGGAAPLGGDSPGGSGGAGGTPPAGQEVAQPSMGCTLQPTIEPGTFAPVTVGGRQTWIHLPPNYDAGRAYPLIFVWKGCSAPGVSSFGLQNVVGDDAILAQGDFPAGADCYDTGDGSMYTDIPVFDALLEHLKTNYCVDKAHVYSVGFSSGAWLTQLLACQRGDVLRGIGTIAGAFKPAFTKGATCAGGGLAAFMVSDLADHTNPFYDEDNDGDSVEVAVNHWLTANGCTETTWTMEAGMPTSPDESVCRSYAGCGVNPVKLCLTNGKGHAVQEQLSMPGFWQLFQTTLPK